MSSSPLALTGSSAVSILDGALSIEKVLSLRELITQSMARVMKEGQHYGKIPGTGDTPTLLQPGAQLLCTLFRLRPEYEIQETEPAPGHKRFRVTCRLYWMGEAAMVVGEGVGEATTMESKHRFRNAAALVEDTGDAVPVAYWNMKREQGPQAANQWLAKAYDGAAVGPKKFPDGEFRVVKFMGGGDEKVENPNPADQWNTVLKMAKKRAFVDATITATSSSDFFTQDLEDMRENMEAVRAAHGDIEAGLNGNKDRKPQQASGQGQPEPGSWRNVVCHIGKPRGPMHGKKLDSLDDGARQWLLNKLGEKGDRRDAKDKKLFAALLLWKAEKDGGGKQKPADNPGNGEGGGGGEGQQPPDDGNAGVNVGILKENLEWAAIPLGSFMETARANKWTNAAVFDNLTDEEAVAMLDRLEEVTEICKEDMAKAGQGGEQQPGANDSEDALFPK